MFVAVCLFSLSQFDNIFFDLQVFQKSVPMAKAGENVGVLIRGVKYTAVRKGMILCLINTMTISNHYEAQMYVMSTQEGGRTKPLPVSKNSFRDRKITFTFYYITFFPISS